MPMQILCLFNSRVIKKYHLSDMYIHSHTLGSIGVTELGTVTFHFAPNRRRSTVDFSVDMIASKKYFLLKV